MIRKIIISIIFLISGISILESQTHPDSCLKMIWPNDYTVITNKGTVNPDSVKIDTCIASATYGKHYAKKYFELKFTNYIFDSVIQPNVTKTVNDISDNYLNIKQQFQQLELELGSNLMSYFPSLPNL
jgi:hypothetical protein